MPEAFVYDTAPATCCDLSSVIKTEVYASLAFGIAASKKAKLPPSECLEFLLGHLLPATFKRFSRLIYYVIYILIY